MALMKFIRSGKKVEVDPTTLLIAALLDIWNSDQSFGKEYSNKMLSYVHLISRIDPLAPYYNEDPDDVVPLAKNEIFGDPLFVFTENEQIMIENAVMYYCKGNEIIEERIYRDFCDKIDEIRKKIRDTKVEIVKNTDTVKNHVTFTSNGAIISKLMKELGDMIKIKDDMYSVMRNARTAETKIKGARKPSFLEDQLIKNEYSTEQFGDTSSSGPTTGESSEVHRQEQSIVHQPRTESQESEEETGTFTNQGKKTHQRKRKAPLVLAEKNAGF